MRNSTAYFAGVTTVFAATALGFGGAMILAGSTASRVPTEPTKLERHVSALAQTSPAPDAKPVATNDSAPSQERDQTPPAATAQPQQSAQQSAPNPPALQTAPPAQTPAQASPRTVVAEPNQSAAAPDAQSPANAYARGSDRDIQRYIHRRDRRWARRHYRDDEAAAQASSSPDQSTPPPSTASSATQQAQPQPVQPQAGSTDQASARVDETDNPKIRRKHDRRWTRGYARDDDGFRGESRGRPVEVRESPRDDASPSFAMPRWRPFFSDNDDD